VHITDSFLSDSRYAHTSASWTTYASTSNPSTNPYFTDSCTASHAATKSQKVP
jgi:hypothetical protein